MKEKIILQDLNHLVKESNIFFRFTAATVTMAVGTVIGVIISHLTSGLKTVGNGLKYISKKIASLLPWMIGFIVSFSKLHQKWLDSWLKMHGY